MSKPTKDEPSKPAKPKLKSMNLTKEEAAKVKGGMASTAGVSGGSTSTRVLPP